MSPFAFVYYIAGFEGCVLKNSPGDCFSAPQLRPQTGESCVACHKRIPKGVRFCFVYDTEIQPSVIFSFNHIENRSIVFCECLMYNVFVSLQV